MPRNVEVFAVPAIRKRDIETKSAPGRTRRRRLPAHGSVPATPGHHRSGLRFDRHRLTGDEIQPERKSDHLGRIDVETGSVIRDALLGNQHLVVVIKRGSPIRRRVGLLLARGVLTEKVFRPRVRVHRDVPEEHVHVGCARFTGVHDGVVGQRVAVRTLHDELPHRALWPGDRSIGRAHDGSRVDGHR
jgi:hypothetical protein